MNAPAPIARTKLISLAIRLTVASALLIFLFSRYADLAQVWQLISRSSARLLALALLVAISGEVITALKWRILVHYIGGRLPIITALRASFIGMFYNNFFPGSVGGDIARVLLIARHAGGKARATASAFMQRNTGLAGLFIIGIPAAFLWPRNFDWPGSSPKDAIPQWITDCRTWLIAAAIGYSSTNLFLFSHAAYSRLWAVAAFEAAHPVPSGIHAALRKLLEKVRRFHMELHGFRFWLPLPLMMSAITQLIDVALVFTLSQALGITISITVLLVTVPVVTLANLAPVTINGIGLREAVYIALLHSTGIQADEAVALSLLHFGVITVLGALGGILHAVTPEGK